MVVGNEDLVLVRNINKSLVPDFSNRINAYLFNLSLHGELKLEELSIIDFEIANHMFLDRLHPVKEILILYFYFFKLNH